MYIAQQDIDNSEFDFAIEKGYVFQDGDFEPDLIAQWLAVGWIKDQSKPTPKGPTPLQPKE